MKKFLLTLTFFILFLTSCNARQTARSGKYLVSAIGFENYNNKIHLFAETVVVNSEDNLRDIENIVFEGVGPDVNSAFKAAYTKSAKPLSLSHTAVIVLGKSITKENLEDIFSFCKKSGEITVSTAFVKCENAKELLSQKPFSSVAVGYDIAAILSAQYSGKNQKFHNRLYEILPVFEKVKELKDLPFFKTENNRVYLYDRE